MRRFLAILLFPSLLLAANPVNSWLDSTSTTDDHSIYLCGMDAANPPDADTLGIEAGWKVIIWSAAAAEAALLKKYDPTVKLILYSSLDHGLRSINLASDTTDPGNEWNTTADEYSHYKKVCTDSSKSYYSLFYHFAEETKILLYPRTTGGYTYYDTVTFVAATLPISDDDSSSVIPDSYSSPYFTSYGTLDTISVDTVLMGSVNNIHRSFRYQGTPQGSKVTRVYLDFSNPLARYAELRYCTRMFAANLDNLGGTGNDVYGWGVMSDSGEIWDGVYFDNSSDESNKFPEGMTLISGGNIRGSTGVLGKWNADSTMNKINSHQKAFFSYITTYCNNGANFSDGVPRATAANFGTLNDIRTSRNPITQWYNDSNKINVKLLEFARLDGGYSVESAHEAQTTLGHSMHQLEQMDSLARANDFYWLVAGRVDYRDTTLASGWAEMKQALMRSNWVRLHTAFGHRALYAVNPLFALASGYQPCNSGGVSYAGLNYTPLCNDRSEVRQFVDGQILPFMNDYDLGQKVADSSATVAAADAQGQTVNVWKTFWRKTSGADTTYSWMYYFPRVSSAWDWRHTGNHYVNVIPPSLDYKRLEYDGTLTDIAGAVQRCYIGDQLILSYTFTGTPEPVESGTKVIIQKVRVWPGADDALDPDPIP